MDDWTANLPAPDYRSDDGSVVLYCGDSLRLLADMPDACVDAVITDPPYSSGGQFRGDRTQKTSTKYVNNDSVATCRTEFAGDNRDQRAYLAWSSMWLGDCLRVAKPGSVAMIFTDWRQLPVTTDAVQCGGWVWRNLVTWWKPGVRMQRGRFSSSAEYVVYCTSGIPTDGECSPQNVLVCQGVPGDNKVHIAEKPVELMTSLLGVTFKSAVVLDPFCGSGTTAVASIQSGRKFIGIERDAAHFATAVKRIEDAFADQGLFTGKVRGETQLSIGEQA